MRRIESFFETIVRQAFERGQLLMLGLFLNDQPIALKCNLLTPSGRGSFAFKIAFDEQKGAISPGYQLEVANIRELHRRADMDWMDSCTAREPSMFDRLWLDRRKMQTTLISTGRLTGNLVVALLPQLQRLKRGLARLWKKS